MYNDNGILTANNPFRIFGTIPNIGASFLFGSKEWLNKSISKLTIRLTWCNDIPTDFNSYYSSYNYYLDQQTPCFKNTSFLVVFSALIDGKWKSLNTKSFRLFDENKEDDSILQISTFNLNFDNDLFFASSTENSDEFKFTDKTRDGFIKMELVAPENGFGFLLYAKVVIAIALYNAALISSWHRKKKLKPAPNIPYSPLTEKIEIKISCLNS